jgi:hypothetical protein
MIEYNVPVKINCQRCDVELIPYLHSCLQHWTENGVFYICSDCYKKPR